MVEQDVELGFLENCQPWQVESRLFPSKVGGKPAWLNLQKLPSSEHLQCKKCQEPLIFLCQVYAPYEEEHKNFINNFHRTIFVFICRNVECCQRNNSDNIKVFRSNLRRANKFYPYDPPDENPQPSFSLATWLTLCNLCGCIAEKQCSKCKKVHYCTRHHQILDWKEGHKTECNNSSESIPNSRSWKQSKILFQEWEIVIEPEEIDTKCFTEEEELEKFKQLEIDGKIGSMADIPEEDLESHAVTDSDKVFSKFQKRVKHNPDQMIRYRIGGQPLWISIEPVPENIPDCELCKGQRQFEFQIMPQMLSQLKENALDWGILAIYTCENSCFLDDSYHEEFVFKQDVAITN
ncbi:programmed cell death protein 2 [Diabrotica undecimpunctata]|uniref:programmed cell death protein 2 n=1 Tax=Diabrotica undecimpunctata TaxID=50387 RepID=UPI003B641F37